jgi:hypothetical protein
VRIIERIKKIEFTKKATCRNVFIACVKENDEDFFNGFVIRGKNVNYGG